MKDELTQAIVDGDDDLAADITRKMIKEGVKRLELMEIFADAGKLVSKISETGTMIHELLATMAMEESFNIFVKEMYTEQTEDSKKVSVVIGTIFGDYHNLGKNMVSHILKRFGFQVIDLGKNVTVETFISKSKKLDADIIAVSVSMDSTRQHLKPLTELMQQNGIRAKLIIGGPVVNKDYADKISANYSPDPFSAVEKIQEIVVPSKERQPQWTQKNMQERIL